MTSPETFFVLVDRHVTGPMAAAGYVKIGDYDELSEGARPTPLIAARSQWLAAKPWFQRLLHRFQFSRRLKGPTEHVLSVGYEGVDKDGESDEKWLAYFPETGELDLLSWHEELSDRADWVVWNDSDVPTTDELERRLRVVGAAMAERSAG